MSARTTSGSPAATPRTFSRTFNNPRSTRRMPMTLKARTQIPAATTIRLWIVVGGFAAISVPGCHEMQVRVGYRRHRHAGVLDRIGVHRVFTATRQHLEG